MPTPKDPRSAVILPFRRRDPNAPPPDRDPIQAREKRINARFEREIDGLLAQIGPEEDVTARIARLEQEGTAKAAADLPMIYLVRSMRRELDQDLSGALADAEHALELAPDDVDVLRTAAKLRARRDEPGSIALLDRAAQIAPTDPRNYLLRGEILAEAGDHERAITNFNRAITLDPTSRAAYAGLAESFEALGRIEDAITACTAALRLDPNNAGLRYARAFYHREKGDTEAEIRDLDRVIKLRPNEPYAIGDRAAAHASLGRSKQAIADYTRAMQLEPDESTFPSARSVLHLQAGALDLAIADLTIAIRLKPSSAAFSWSRAVARHASGDLEGAIGDYELAITKEPKETHLRASLARCLFTVGRTADALRVNAEGLALEPDNVELLLDRAEILRRGGDDDAAPEALEKRP